ncbi:MAG: histidine phosphatase family protein [Anaerolineaceae bacterium]|nr:histidine phosphatase family protein [Anaerolineaceae bacterium]
MKKLILMRHGKSSWKETQLSDFERPLKKRGRKDARKMGKMLKSEGLIPEYFLVSPSVRTRETLDELMDKMNFDGDAVEFVEEFYHAEVDDYLSRMEKLSDDLNTVMIIGHNPTLEELLQVLTGDIEALPTAAIAYIKLPIKHWEEVADEDMVGKLKDLWVPKALD